MFISILIEESGQNLKLYCNDILTESTVPYKYVCMYDDREETLRDGQHFPIFYLVCV